ncbi:MAG: hypothetical protein HC902_08755 [Calothrix sp. SM1_5_4]|nr:hypothetical protein [Calothrix sp. SM1_5_4]
MRNPSFVTAWTVAVFWSALHGSDLQASAASSADINSACLAKDKGAKLCACVSRLLKGKNESRDIGDDQMRDVVAVLRGTFSKDPEKQAYEESLQDLIAGLEQQCRPLK